MLDANDTKTVMTCTDCRPADLYGKFTWKIANFSDVKKRELRSKAFTVGAYKWCVSSALNLVDLPVCILECACFPEGRHLFTH